MFGDFINYVQQNLDKSVVTRNVIANNIANYNTPDFKAQSVNFESHLGLSKGELKTTNVLHISGSSSSNKTATGVNYEIVENSDGEARVDGNNVDQTSEMIKMLENNSVYTNSVNALNKEYSLIKTAIGS